ncbi:polysaccharide deacetylase family protein [Acuticoccus kandeliae]|uniref:polysaccharide deacetylase family protein n=1 Tax=Acuticoccus kandeliae TaxID=2073160 RepID=UPI000D3E6042|nr:polysaccharide deacetylase family protein [Acuticoccus kandeliae]
MTRPGMDHPHYDFSPIDRRPPLGWPDGKPLAVSVILYFEHWRTFRRPEAVSEPRFNDPFGNFEPDYRAFTLRQYGLRVGIFRLLAAFDRLPVKVTVAANAEAIENYPFLVEAFLKRGYEFAGHGINAREMISSRMSEAEEAAVIARTLETIEAATGTRPVGWISQDYGESTRTPQLLAEAGLDYVCDWANDDQPYKLKTTPGIVSIPNQADLDDIQLMWHRRIEARRYRDIIGDAADQLAAEGRESGRFLGVHLHPWLAGMPHRIRAVTGMLNGLGSRDDVWFAQAAEIARHARDAFAP